MTVRPIAAASLLAGLVLAPGMASSQGTGSDFVGALRDAYGASGGSTASPPPAPAPSSSASSGQTSRSAPSSGARVAPAPAIPVSEEGRQTQIALNYFGFNAGFVDGQVGPGTRAAIERYQASMGYPVDGRAFDEAQFNYLIDAYDWATEGGEEATGLSGEALLLAYAGTLSEPEPEPAPEQGGEPEIVVTIDAPVADDPSTEAPSAAQADQATPALALPDTTEASPPEIVPSDPALAVLLSDASQIPAVSLAEACVGIDLPAPDEVGFTTAEDMMDPHRVLAEQFCLARLDMMAQAEALQAALGSVSEDELVTQCALFADTLSPFVGLAGSAAVGSVVPDMRGFALQTGQSPAEMTTTARICLGAGYRGGDLRMAAGAALYLVSVGEAAYAEVMGHHLRNGFGIAERPDLALDWYDTALKALQEGQSPAVMPSHPARIGALQAAVARILEAGPDMADQGFPVFPVTP